ncbi:permease prefix domain 1-containing protein, partial [Deinococcus sp.]|uniref:permease prefix domain 1-containing protein n=1 Tax=Deinococcus sp. TaxID=47478 RepID=UPI002869A867
MSDDDDLYTYLTRATRGLRARQRQDVRSELLGHIEARVQDFRVDGHSDAEALRRTLAELGAPAHVHRGMQRVYVWPQAMRGSMLGALACTAVYAMLHLSGVLAQVEGYHPAFTPLPGPYTYVDTGSLWSELQKAGVTLQGLPAAPTLHLPGQDTPIRMNPDADHSSGFVNRTFIRDYASGRTFLDLNAVVTAVTAAGIDVHVEGWQNPTLHLGSVGLTLGTPDHPLDAYNLYDMALRPLALTLGLGSQRSSRMDDISVFSHHALRVAAPAGTLYALASVRRLSRGLARGDAVVLAYDLAQVDAGGQL